MNVDIVVAVALVIPADDKISVEISGDIAVSLIGRAKIVVDFEVADVCGNGNNREQEAKCPYRETAKRFHRQNTETNAVPNSHPNAKAYYSLSIYHLRRHLKADPAAPQLLPEFFSGHRCNIFYPSEGKCSHEVLISRGVADKRKQSGVID